MIVYRVIVWSPDGHQLNEFRCEIWDEVIDLLSNIGQQQMVMGNEIEIKSQ